MRRQMYEDSKVARGKELNRTVQLLLGAGRYGHGRAMPNPFYGNRLGWFAWTKTNRRWLT